MNTQFDHVDEFTAVLEQSLPEPDVPGTLEELNTKVETLKDRIATLETASVMKIGNRNYVKNQTWWSQMREKTWSGDNDVLYLHSDTQDNSVTYGHSNPLNPNQNLPIKMAKPYILTQSFKTYTNVDKDIEAFTSITNGYHELNLTGSTLTKSEGGTPNFTPVGIIAYNKIKGCCGVNGFFARVSDIYYSDQELKYDNNSRYGASKSCGMGAMVTRRANYSQGLHGSSYSIGGEFVCYNNAEEDGPEGDQGYCGNRMYHDYSTWVNPLHLVGGGNRPVTDFILLNGHAWSATKVTEMGLTVNEEDGTVIKDKGTARTQGTNFKYAAITNGGYNGITIGASAMTIKKRPVKKFRKELNYSEDLDTFVYTGSYTNSDEVLDGLKQVVKHISGYYVVPNNVNNGLVMGIYVPLQLQVQNNVLTSTIEEAPTSTKTVADKWGVNENIITPDTENQEDISKAIALMYVPIFSEQSISTSDLIGKIEVYLVNSNLNIAVMKQQVSLTSAEYNQWITYFTSTDSTAKAEALTSIKNKLIAYLAIDNNTYTGDNTQSKAENAILEETYTTPYIREILVYRKFLNTPTRINTSGNSHQTAGITTENWTQKGVHGYTIIRNGYAPRFILSRGRIISEAPAFKFINPKGIMATAIASMQDVDENSQRIGGNPYLDFKIGTKADYYENPTANTSDLVPKENPTESTVSRFGFDGVNNVLNISSKGAISIKINRQFTQTEDASVPSDDETSEDEQINTSTETTSLTSVNYNFSENGIELSASEATPNLGTYNAPWNDVFTTKSPILMNKTIYSFGDFTSNLFTAWGNVGYHLYKYSATDQYHIGLLAQDIIAAFSTQNLNAEDYGLVYSKTVNGTTYYGVRTEECIAMEGAYLRYLANSANTYTITFLSEDGNTTLATASNVPYYGNATYTGTTPTKIATAQYTYIFDGWSTTLGGDLNEGALSNITSNKSVYAHFKREKREYAVTFKDYETVLQQVQILYGNRPEYSGLPILPKQDMYSFYGWVNGADWQPESDEQTIIVPDDFSYTIVTDLTTQQIEENTTYYAVFERIEDET